MVELEGIAFGYGKRGRLFDGLDLTLTPGNVYGLLGRNGAGKTTLLRLMSGLLFPKAGSARAAGEAVRRRTPAFLRELYFVPEEFHTPALSARALVGLYGVFYPRFDHAAMERYLAELEVDPNQSMTTMSYGQKKKVLLAFAVASQCWLLILDEPTNGLDIPAKNQFRRPLAGAAGSPGNGHAIYVELSTGAGGVHAGRALVPAARGGPMSEAAIDLELLFNSVCAD